MALDGSVKLTLIDLDTLVETVVYNHSAQDLWLSYKTQNGGHGCPDNNYLSGAFLGYFGLPGEVETWRITDAAASVTPAPPPVTTPLGPQTPCLPQTTVNNGGKGKSGCNTGGQGFTLPVISAYGTVPVHADVTDGETLKDKPQVDLWFDLRHLDTSDVTTAYQRAKVELGDLNTYERGRKSAGLMALGDIEYSISNEQGGPETATINIQYSDAQDRLLRTQLETEEYEGDEIYIKAASPVARKAATTPRIFLRGIVQKPPTLNNPMMATIAATDSMFADSGPFGSQRKWPLPIPAGVFSAKGAPQDTLSLSLPWLYGIKTDEGASDPITGQLLSKGLCPLIFAGQESITAPVSNLPTSGNAPPTYPTGQMGPLGGDGSFISDGTVTSDPFHAVGRVDAGVLTMIDFNRAATPSIAGTVFGFRIVWFDPNPVPPDYYIVFQIPAGFPTWDAFANPAPAGTNIRYKTFGNLPTHPFPDWDFGVVYFTSPDDGNAWPPGPSNDLWDIWIAFGHPIYSVISLYASNLGNGDPSATPDRVQIDLNAHGGVDFLVPGYPNWPFAQTYREYTDTTDGTVYWLTVIYAKGPISEDAKKGRVTMAINAVGIEDKGDGTGLPLIDLELCKQHWLENPVLSKWTSGLWADNTTYPKWNDGTPKVKSTTFVDRQAYQAASFGGRGLTASWYIPKADTMSAHVKELNKTESFLGFNEQGQWIDFGLDERVDTSTWPVIDHVTRIFGAVQWGSGIQRENVVVGTGDWDPDADKWRWPNSTFSSATGITRYKHQKKSGDPINLLTLNDQGQINWVLRKRLARLANSITTIDIEGDKGFCDNGLGTGISLTTIEGTGASGYVNRKMLIMRKKINLSKKPMTVTYTLWDVQNLLPSASLPGGLAQVPIVTNTAGKAWIVSNSSSVAPVVIP